MTTVTYNNGVLTTDTKITIVDAREALTLEETIVEVKKLQQQGMNIDIEFDVKSYFESQYVDSKGNLDLSHGKFIQFNDLPEADKPVFWHNGVPHDVEAVAFAGCAQNAVKVEYCMRKYDDWLECFHRIMERNLDLVPEMCQSMTLVNFLFVTKTGCFFHGIVPRKNSKGELVFVWETFFHAKEDPRTFVIGSGAEVLNDEQLKDIPYEEYDWELAYRSVLAAKAIHQYTAEHDEFSNDVLVSISV